MSFMASRVWNLALSQSLSRKAFETMTIQPCSHPIHELTPNLQLNWRGTKVNQTKEVCMIIDGRLFEQEWFSELPLRLRFLYVYLLTKCTKTGIFEVNLRKISHDVNDGIPVTKDDIFKSFGNRVRPLGESKGIFVDYITFNWVRGKPLDPERNPLHRGLAKELAKHGLDFSMVCEMANKKFTWVGGRNAVFNRVVSVSHLRSCVSSGALDGTVHRDSGEVP